MNTLAGPKLFILTKFIYSNKILAIKRETKKPKSISFIQILQVKHYLREKETSPIYLFIESS